MLGGSAPPGGGGGGEELLTVTIQRDEHGYGMKVSGDNPVYVQSVKEHGAAWRAGLRAGDRILRVGTTSVLHHTHQQVVHMIRANPTTVLTVHQNASRHKTPITAPVPVNPEKQRQLEVSKVHTVRLMLEQEQKYIRDLRNELSKVPDVRKQTQLESAEQRCSILQHEIDTIMAGQPEAPSTPRLNARTKSTIEKCSPPPPANTGFLSGLPRSLSNLTGQSLRSLRQRQTNKQQENQPPLLRQNSDESNKRRHVHNNTVPMVPTTCLDNVTPPPLPPRSSERPKRHPLSPTMSPPLNPLAKPKPGSSASPIHNQYFKGRYGDKNIPFPMHQSMPAYNDNANKLRMSSHSLDGELDGPQPNSIAMQMAYPLVNAPPPPLQTDNRGNVPVLHVRSQSSPEHLDHDVPRPMALEKEAWSRGTPPPGTPPPPYAHNTQPCADPQRAIISMEEDDSPASDNSTYSSLFSNLRTVRESKARTAVLLNWLLGERRCACACLVLALTDAYRAAPAPLSALRRWAYEIHSTFLMPNAVLQLNGVDENMANEIEHVLVNEYEKEEILRNVFRKARQKAKEELGQQLSEFQVKRQVGLGTLYGPDDAVLEKCDVDRAQEQVVVESVMCARLASVAAGAAHGCGGAAPSADAHHALLAALIAAALCLHCRPASVAAAVGGQRASFLQRDKLYKQRTKQLAKLHPQPFTVRGHHLQLQALTSVGHCHHCDNVIWGLAPQAYVCVNCKLRVHRSCAKSVEEGCCLDGEREREHNNRISRFMERRIHTQGQNNSQDSSDKKSRKVSGAANFLNMERSFRKMEDEQPWDQTLTPSSAQERRDESDESLYESADCHSDVVSASDDALPRLGKTPTMSKESLKLAVTDEEAEVVLRNKKTHRKTMSLSNPLEIVKTLGDEWFDSNKKELDKHSDKIKSRESLWSEEDRDSIHGSTIKLDQIRKNSKKEDKSQSASRKSSTADPPKSRKTSKASSVSSFNFLRRKKTPTVAIKAVEAVVEVVDKIINTEELLNYTKVFLEEEKRYSAIRESKPIESKRIETDSEEEPPTPKLAEHRRRLSRQTSRSKSKVRGKSQSVKVNTLRKSHSGTLKKNKKKSIKTPLAGRSRQASVVEQTPIMKKKSSDVAKHNSWLFSGSRGEPKREGSTEDTTAPEAEQDNDVAAKDAQEKDNNWRAGGGARGVNRAESCRERDAPRRGKHRNASDPNRLTAINHNDLEPGAGTAPSGSSSSSSLSSRSNESNTVAADHHASASDWSDDEPLAAQWADSLPPHTLDSLTLSARLRKRQELIHELIVSEGSHVRWLRVLGGVFLRPLESQPSLLPAEELRALFPNLPGVKERHSKLYSDLRALRSSSTIVHIRPVADALLNTLGDSGYASCLARFCRGQRMALEALKERRRKNKELHQFLLSREQMPLCGRLQLRDLMACVWQRLTKYQLLLEGILKTVVEKETDTETTDEEPTDAAEDALTLRRALAVAKDVLHSVDTAIRTAENDHRLRTIQSKLEIRIPCSGSEWEEPKRLDLTQHALRWEAELSIRNDSNKKITVLGLMLEQCLVLLQREGERFVLKPITQPSQQGLLSPLIKWDRVLWRPNAAVRNTFFLMNINGVQMHELSANSAAEYSTWVKHMEGLPLAKPELKPALTPHHQPSRSTDDSGINVSRNPSDASEKSEKSVSSVPEDESERDRNSVDRTSERDRVSAERTEEKEKRSVERDERRSLDREEASDREEKHKPRRGTVGRVCVHGAETGPGEPDTAVMLEPAAALTVHEPAAAHTALRVYTQQERLRRLDAGIARALRAKSAIVGSLLGIQPNHYAQLADLAVADSLGQVDLCGELRASRLSRSNSAEEGGASPSVSSSFAPDVHTLLLAAQAQANQLTELLSSALSVEETALVGARARAGAQGRCQRCRPRAATPTPTPPRAAPEPLDTKLDDGISMETETRLAELAEEELERLAPASEFGADPEPPFDVAFETGVTAAALAARLVGVCSGLQSSLARLTGALPTLAAAARAHRATAAVARDAADAHLHRLVSGYSASEEISFPKESVEQSIQDQPSNGG